MLNIICCEMFNLHHCYTDKYTIMFGFGIDWPVEWLEPVCSWLCLVSDGEIEFLLEKSME